MSLLEWLKFWSKSYSLPLFCSTEYPPSKNENCQRVQIRGSQNTPPKMKIVRQSKSEGPRIPPQKIQTSNFFSQVQIRGSQNTPPIQTSNFFSKVQIQGSQNTPPPNQNGKISDFKLQNSLAIREILYGD